MNNDLSLFVRESLLKGVSRKDMESALKQNGWQADEIHEALSAFGESSLPIPVPRRKPYLSAREAFLYLVLFLTLYISAISFGTLLFQFIIRAYPDVLLNYGSGYDSTALVIRYSTSSLIIAYPIFLWLSWLMNAEMQKRPDKRGSKIRKWLTYFTLFVAAGVIIGDLITLVFNVLGGELTTRFILKVLVVLAISGAIFGYYLWDLRKEEKEQ